MNIVLTLVVLLLIGISTIFLWKVVAGIIAWIKVKKDGIVETPPIILTKKLVIGGIIEHAVSLITIIAAIILIIQCKH